MDAFRKHLREYVPGGYEDKSTVPNRALQQARVLASGDPEVRVQWLPNLIAHLNADGHEAELVTCDSVEMKQGLMHHEMKLTSWEAHMTFVKKH